MLNILVLSVLATSLHSKHVRIQMDFEDVLKLLKIPIPNNVFRKASDKVEDKPIEGKPIEGELSKYNNPYHPEDDVKDAVTLASEPDYKKLAEKVNGIPKLDEVIIEKDNKVFEEKGQIVSEDDLDLFDTMYKPLPEKTPSDKNVAEIKSDDNKSEAAKEKASDMKGFKDIQKRFVRKSSGDVAN